MNSVLNSTKELVDTIGGTDMSANRLLSSFLEWAKNTFTDAYKEEVQAYLCESVDYADLENRIKLLKVRGLF
jgi:hypothetical protein